MNDATRKDVSAQLANIYADNGFSNIADEVRQLAEDVSEEIDNMRPDAPQPVTGEPPVLIYSGMVNRFQVRVEREALEEEAGTLEEASDKLEEAAQLADEAADLLSTITGA